MNRGLYKSLFLILALLPASSVLAYKTPAKPGTHQVPPDPNSEEFKSIQIVDKAGDQVDIENLKFRNEEGEEVVLASFFDGKRPVVLNLMYYTCPSLCSLLLNGIVESLRRIDWTLGEEYQMITLSIDPRETWMLAADKKENYVKDYGKPVAAKGWHFLTGDKDQIQALAKQVGFGYRWIEEDDEYAHSAGFFVLSPKGKVSRTLYGVQFEPKNVKLSLVEAAEGKVGSFADKLLLFCFRYDPSSKGYALHAFRLMQAGGAITAIILAIFLFRFWARQRKSRPGAGA